MPKQISPASTAATKIKIKTKEEILESKFELTESNLKKWLLGQFEKRKAIVDDAYQQMIKEGVSEKLAKNCTYWHPHAEEKRARDVLKLVINEKTGKLWNISTLQQAGILSDLQVDNIIREHKKVGNSRVPPYYYISQMQRIVDEQDRSKSYLTAYCIFEGIAVGSLKDQPWQKYEGDRINHSFNLGYYSLPILSPRTVKDSDGENKRVLEHNWELGHWEGQRVYDIPFEVSTFEEMMKHVFGSLEDGKIGLSIPTANIVYGIHSIDEFLTDDLPGLIKRKQEPQPTYKFDIDPKALADFMKYQEAMKQQGQNHYG